MPACLEVKMESCCNQIAWKTCLVFLFQSIYENMARGIFKLGTLAGDLLANRIIAKRESERRDS